jgi:Holliday junction resolvase RusA-like endonuclease
VIVRFPLTPIGKPRQTRSDKWKQRPVVVKYRKWADCLRGFAHKARFVFPEAGVQITFVFPMPASWSAKKKSAMRGMPHQAKPDWDNCAKAVCDALVTNDESIWHIAGVRKLWGDEGYIELEIEDGRALNQRRAG